jgi:hypothetical protein
MNFKAAMRPAVSFCLLTHLFFTCGCTLVVEKVEKFGVNDHQYEYPPAIGSREDPDFRFCCNGTISTHTSEFDKGRYEIVIKAKGTPAYEVYPLIRVLLNNTVQKEIRLDGDYTTYRIPFVLQEKKTIGVQIQFDQDGVDDKGNDRDVLIRKISVVPAEH